MRDFINKYKISIFAFLITIIPGLIILMITMSNHNMHTIKTKTYNLTYNSSWKLKSKKDNNIIFTHGKDNKLTIKIIDLNDDIAYKDIKSIIDVVRNQLLEENKGYKLINEKDELLTRNNYQGYKYLFEKDNYNAISAIYKTEDKLIMFNYTASIDYFDILLDSVNDIIYNFSLTEYKTNLGKGLKLDLKEYGNKEYKKLKTKSYTFANHNYEVTINIPSIFVQTYYSNESPSFKYSDEIKNNVINVEIRSYIMNSNIYYYIEYNNIIKPYSIFKKDYYGNKDQKHLDYKEETFKLNNGFLYKESYNYIDYKKMKDYVENYKLVYPLDKIHSIKIDIDSINYNDIESIIKNISISKKVKYSTYTKHKHIGDKLSFDLKYISYSSFDKKTKEKKINIKIPDYYKEVECPLKNINEERCFVYGYNDKMGIYDYEIEFRYENKIYSDIATEAQTHIRIFDPGQYKYTYGKVEKYTRINNYKNKDKEFIVYKGSYTDRAFNYGIYDKYNCNYRMLFHYLGDSDNKYDNNGMLVIKITGNNKNIDSKMYEDFVNFTFTSKNR